jgi:hypothetical protein
LEVEVALESMFPFTVVAVVGVEGVNRKFPVGVALRSRFPAATNVAMLSI